MLGNLDKMVEKSKVCMRIQSHLILVNRPFFTDTAVILNLLHLRSTMGCPGDTRSVYTLGQKENFAVSVKRSIEYICHSLTSKHASTIFFPITIPFFF